MAGAFFVINLVLAVIFENFDGMNAAVEEEKAEAVTESGEGASSGPDDVKETLEAIERTTLQVQESINKRLPCVSRVVGCVRRLWAASGCQTLCRGCTRAEECLFGKAHDKAKQLVETTFFDHCVVTVILANTLVLCLDSTPPPFGMSTQALRARDLRS